MEIAGLRYSLLGFPVLKTKWGFFPMKQGGRVLSRLNWMLLD